MGTANTLRFGIDGMTCGGCVGRAEQALAHVAGLTDPHVNLADASARITVLDADTGRLASAALAKAGYPARPKTVTLQIADMTCASCVGRVEAALQAVPGVITAQVNLVDGRARIETLGSVETLIPAVQVVGYAAKPVTDAAQQKPEADPATALFRQFLIAAILTLPVFVMEMGGHIFPAFHHWIAQTIGTPASWTIQFILSTLVLAGPGRVFFAKGLPALRRGAPDMNALVVLGTGAAWVFSTLALFAPGLLPVGTRAVYFEAAAVIVTLILLGRWLEARAKSQTGAAIKGLMGLQPKTARVLRDGVPVDVPLADIAIDDLIALRPGERVATDGLVTDGQTAIDESMITGEPVPVAKMPGGSVVGGTVNGTGAITYRATAVGADTMLARIITMVGQAQGARLPVQDLVNKITLWFVPAVMAVALLTILIWLVFGPAPSLSYALVAGVAVLIVACPCAMGLATPMAIMVGTGRAAGLGVLFRRGEALQTLQDVTLVAFDKTGTLTQGKPSVTDVIVLSGSEAGLLRQVAAVEALSEHPLAAAILAAAPADVPTATGFKSIPGKGLRAVVDGADVSLGTAAFLTELGVDTAPLQGDAATLAKAGKTPVLVAVDGRAAGVIGIADQLRPTARKTIEVLQNKGLQVAMVSGDRPEAADAVAKALSVSEVVAGVLPEGKVEALRRWQAAGHKVAFVGDGINDAPVLAAADVGIAIGTGTDIAMETADVVLMSGDPRGVLNALTLSRATLANIRQNLFWAFGYNTALIPVAAGVLFPVWGMLLSPALAAGAMALSSVLVVTNALRLRRIKGVS